MPHAALALTTTELGLLTTAAVGIAAITGPALTAWANRKHEREQARSARLYAQRHGAYLELARFLERQRLMLSRIEPLMGPLPDPPDPVDDEAWLDMRSRWVTLASEDVQAALSEAGRRFGGFAAAVAELRAYLTQDAAAQLMNARMRVDETRERAHETFNDAERAMNDELARMQVTRRQAISPASTLATRTVQAQVSSSSSVPGVVFHDEASALERRLLGGIGDPIGEARE